MSDVIQMLTDADGRPLVWSAAADVFAHNCPDGFAARVRYFRDAARVTVGTHLCKPSLRLAVSAVRGFDMGIGSIPISVELRDCRTVDGNHELRLVVED